MRAKLFISQAEALRLSEVLSQVMHPNAQTFKKDQTLLNDLKTFSNMVLESDIVESESLTEIMVTNGKQADEI